ncbi:hypothetical protein I302_106370 [Kwoniella bestiolae CBS 10118]|uniref:Defect at low temperature protein 1 n=1 Tax=Kwoniella bestiolae CBS 10118 TaxID=1296100 RepID=A0A1B9G3Q8_9TREE|nr:hypothetical protein I302_05493 [Kwoniella bestiolae CBS 10118]OCF25669.1 hypothetical protein I302_05493 [Kwoniella bestiolae CBS 10118]
MNSHPPPIQSPHTAPTYPPRPSRASATTKTQRKRQSQRRYLPTVRGFLSFLYHASFYLFILITAALLVASAFSIGEQAWRNGGQRKWNIFVMVAAYVALGIISVLHVWSRVLSVKRILRTMPKPYIPTKQVDLPKTVAKHIATEYSRTAVIAHISQATTGQQEGWGRPGTKWEDKHFRTYILSTIPIMRQTLAPTSIASPLSLQPLLDASSSINDNGAIRLFVNSYAKIIDRARYGRKEPSQADAEAVEKVVEVVLLTLEVKRRREKDKDPSARP